MIWMHKHTVKMGGKNRAFVKKRDSYPIILVFDLTYLQFSKAGTSQTSCKTGRWGNRR